MQIVFVREANRIPIRDITLSSDNERRKSSRIYFNMHFSRRRCHHRLFVLSVGSVVYLKDRNDSLTVGFIMILFRSGDQSMTSTTPSATIAETKKKKERRKDKENANVETSDEEAAEMPGWYR
jgi:hypothetical protein